MTRLSHSAAAKYSECGFKFDLHYNHKLRPDSVRSALFFGSALDNAINELLLGKSDGVDVFINSLTKYDLHGTIELIPGNPKFLYSQTDFDHEIFTPEELASVNCSTQTELGCYYSEYLKSKKNGTLSSEEESYLNKLYWTSLKRKGLMMLQAYKDQVAPRIKKVVDVQRAISVTNDDGDSITGFVDLIAEWETGETIIFDLKTSGKPYKDDSVITSPQLGLYCLALESILNTRKCGFIVMNKDIKKKRSKGVVTPYVSIQVIIDEMPITQDDSVIDSFNIVNIGVKEEKFDKNLESCYKYGKCEMYNFCHKGDTTGLVKIEKDI